MQNLKVGSLYILSSSDTRDFLSWDEVKPDSVGGLWPAEAILLITKDNVRTPNARMAYLGLLLQENCRVYLYKKEYDFPLEEVEVYDQ
jgi:hypothetical protein